MAYQSSSSMSPPAQKPSPAPAPYPAFATSTSPPNGSAFPPPAKRQKLSPDAPSPQGINGHFNHSAPTVGAYGAPYAQSPVQSPYAASPQTSFNIPQPYQPQLQWQSQPGTPAGRSGSPPNPSQSSQTMPPPPRPNKEEKDERITADDFGDSLFGSGINLKDEENYMHSTFSNRHHESFATQSTSFGSSTLSPNNSFNLLTQGTTSSSQGHDGPFAGTLGQPLSQEDIDAQERQRRQAAANALNESLQQHLRNQFLNGNSVRRRLDMVARNEGVMLPTRGLYVRTDVDRAQTNVAVNGDGKEGVVAVKAESLVEQGSQFDHLLSLVSLAAGDRLRTLVDESHALARARRYGDHGIVPPEFADIAVGEGKRRDEQVIPANVTCTQWDKIPEAASPHQNGNVDKAETPQPLNTISFAGKIHLSLRDLAERDRLAEKERTKKREARKRQAENVGKEEGGDDISAPDTPATEMAPKLTKKEQQKQARAAASAIEAESHGTTNATATMMAFGRKGAKYSWMSSAQVPSNRFKPTTGSGSTTPAAGKASVSGDAAMSRVGSGTGEKAPEWGDFREDGVGGRGIQSRDLALVLDRDGREKKALQRVWNQLGSSS